MQAESSTLVSRGLRGGGNVELNRARGSTYRAAFLAQCEAAIATGIALPPREELLARCGMASRSALNRTICYLYAAGDVVPLPHRPGAAQVFRLRDGRTTPG